MKSSAKALTLVETLIVLALIAIITQVGLPSLAKFSSKIESRQHIVQLKQAISYTRIRAITHESRTSFCPLGDNASCGKDWNEELSIFTDLNNNRRLDINEEILRTIPAVSTEDIQRSFNNRVISFNSRGFAGFSSGSLSYCRTDIDSEVFIISRIGRVRRGTDKNGDGIPETAGGKTIPCPSN